MPTEKVTDSEAASARKRKTFRAPQFIEIYSNASQGAFTPWDIEITFGKLDQLDGETAIADLVTVKLSPQHAKAVLKVLEGAVRGYEAVHGEIKLSDGQQPRLTTPQPQATPQPQPKAK
jgi:hypothetical protein